MILSAKTPQRDDSLRCLVAALRETIMIKCLSLCLSLFAVQQMIFTPDFSETSR